MTQNATLWFWDKGPLNQSWREVYSFSSEEHPKPSIIHSPDSPSAEPVYSSLYLDNQRLRVYLLGEHLTRTPLLWYLYLVNDSKHLPNQTLIGFATDHFPDGTIVSIDDVKTTGLGPMDRVAAINWGLYDPKLYQLYVADGYRRMRIGTKIINTADILHVGRGNGTFIYGGDQATDLGNQFGMSYEKSTRRMARQIAMPPMD